MSCHAALELDHHGRGASPVHGLDPLAKLLAAAGVTLAAISFPKHATGELLPLFLFPALLMALGQVPLRPFFRLLLIGLPFAVMAGVWNIFLDPARVRLPSGVEFSAGWLSFLSILLRYLLTAGTVLALIGTTSFPRLLQAFIRLHAPHAFVQLLNLLYRYIFVLTEEGRALTHAWQLRCPQRRLPDPAVAAGLAGNLFLRTEARSRRIYRAMTLRGYDGTLPFRTHEGWTRRDLLFLLLVLAATAAVRLLPLTQWLGGAALKFPGVQ